MVYRVYDNKERPDEKRNSHIYGWTCSKKVLKAFIHQRGEKKYLVKKMTMEELTNRLHNHDYDATGRYAIDFIKLKSVKNGEEFKLFMTANEMKQVEREVQRIFEDLSDLDRIDPDNISRYVNMVANLNEKFYDALFYLGYRPKEIEAAFDSPLGDMCTNPYDGIECEEYYQSNSCNDEGRRQLTAYDDVSNKIIYSIESFIKVMRKDL